MGFDLYGQNPTEEETKKDRGKGAYFRNNVWWWRPLWDYVCDVCDDIITEEDHKRGCYNDGWLIDDTKAKRIATQLNILINNGSVKKYEEDYKKELNELPLVECPTCNGKGVRDDEIVKGNCNGCGGIGKKDDWALSYPFESDNVQEFADFCENSGGFEIC